MSKVLNPSGSYKIAAEPFSANITYSTTLLTNQDVTATLHVSGPITLTYS